MQPTSRLTRLTILALATGAATMVGASMLESTADARPNRRHQGNHFARAIQQCRVDSNNLRAERSRLTTRLNRMSARSYRFSKGDRMRRVINRAKTRSYRIMAQRTATRYTYRHGYRYYRSNDYRQRRRYRRATARCRAQLDKMKRANRVLAAAIERVKRIRRSSYRTDRHRWDQRRPRPPRVTTPPPAPPRIRDHRAPRNPRF